MQKLLELFIFCRLGNRLHSIAKSGDFAERAERVQKLLELFIFAG
jgi:hypothetical protein